jgi:hypothetical protein
LAGNVGGGSPIGAASDHHAANEHGYNQVKRGNDLQACPTALAPCSAAVAGDALTAGGFLLKSGDQTGAAPNLYRVNTIGEKLCLGDGLCIVVTNNRFVSDNVSV